MRAIVLILIAAAALSADQQLILAYVPLKGTEELYASPIWRQSVAFDAPVIEPAKTLELLKQLDPLIPKSGYICFEKLNQNNDPHSDRNEALLLMHTYLSWLIQLSTEKNSVVCRHDRLINMDWHLKSVKETLLSSPERNKPWGPNIVAYMKQAKLDMVKYCQTLLEQELKGSDFLKDRLKLIEDVSMVVLPMEGVRGMEQYSRLLDDRFIAKGIQGFLRSQFTNFDKRLRKDESRQEIINRFEALREACGHIPFQIESAGFIMSALRDQLVSAEVAQNKQLLKLGAKIHICWRLRNNLNVESIGIKLKKRDKLRNLLF